MHGASWWSICQVLETIYPFIRLPATLRTQVYQYWTWLLECSIAIQLAALTAWQRAYTIAVDALRTIQPLAAETLTNAENLIKYLALETDRIIRATGSFLAEKFSAFVEYVKSQFLKVNYPPDDPPPEQRRKRILFIVSLPYGRSYEALKASFVEEGPSTPSIDWDGNQTDNIPDDLCEINVRRHFAVCLIPIDIWTDPTYSLVRKFQAGRYWELIGPELIPKEGDCVCWDEQKIRHVDSVFEVGITTFSDGAISEDFYRPLRDAWSGGYNVVWWNSFDFAIRLACLIPCGNDKTRLKTIEEFYEFFRWGNVLRKKETSGMKGFFAGFSGFVTSIFSGAAAAEAMALSFTPLIPVAGIASLGIGMASCAYVWWSNSREETAYLREWTERCKGLRKDFLSLLESSIGRRISRTG
ncbi:hypothetical protein VTN00DRAFT_898 [Thermoascus crustaceus]|uniref:uncharacterized protein n=1 Tax=Thermoascus crustaceus TaxID=5088 RepID=UPI0037445141